MARLWMNLLANDWGMLTRGMAGLIATLVLGGCGASSPPPTVEIGAPSLRERSGEGLVLVFPVRLTNTGDEELELRSVRYSFAWTSVRSAGQPDGDGAVAFEGERSPEATLRRHGTQAFEIPVAVATAASAGGAASYRIEGSVRYVSPTPLEELLYDSRLRRPSVVFHGEGEIDLAAPASGSSPPAPPTE